MTTAELLACWLVGCAGYLQYQNEHGWTCPDAALYTANILDKARIPYRIVYGDNCKPPEKPTEAHVWIEILLPGGKIIVVDWYQGGTEWERILIEDKSHLEEWAKE